MARMPVVSWPESAKSGLAGSPWHKPASAQAEAQTVSRAPDRSSADARRLSVTLAIRTTRQCQRGSVRQRLSHAENVEERRRDGGRRLAYEDAAVLEARQPKVDGARQERVEATVADTGALLELRLAPAARGLGRVE
jgi:hypothetical protein